MRCLGQASDNPKPLQALAGKRVTVFCGAPLVVHHRTGCPVLKIVALPLAGGERPLTHRGRWVNVGFAAINRKALCSLVAAPFTIIPPHDSAES